MQVSAVLGATVLVSIIMNEAISACRFLKVEGSYISVSTILGRRFLYVCFYCIMSNCSGFNHNELSNFSL